MERLRHRAWARGAPALSDAPRTPTSWLKVSVVVPARDEMAILEKATRSKLESDDPNLEIVLVDDRSTDGTRDFWRGTFYLLAELRKGPPRNSLRLP